MTQSSRTTETINRDNAGIREIMHRIRELTVPDRATVALGLIGHLATLMNRRQMTKLLAELQEEATRVQDVPPARQREQPDEQPRSASERSGERGDARDSGTTAAGSHAAPDARAVPDVRSSPDVQAAPAESPGTVGQAGRGAFRSGELL